MPELPLLAAGRDADVFDLGDRTVLRPYRHRPVPRREVEVMRYVHSLGYPVPRVVSVTGAELTLERIDGPTMQDALIADPGRIEEQAALLAGLHHRLHALQAPDWLPRLGPGDHVLHLDLHPRNVINAATAPWSSTGRTRPRAPAPSILRC